ncbi:MAG TPA: OsmC family protein [Solirubrobacteraceae bacterium]|nr:OsmC family protein [Solirubrobacteraceae bacterium]
MKAISRRTGSPYAHELEIRQHRLTVDEPQDAGGQDTGPTPQELLAASLASCTAITVEMYAARKGWEVGQLEVECHYTEAESGGPTHFELVLRLPSSLDEEQRQRLRRIAARCPVHRTLTGETVFEDRVEVVDQSTT